MLPTFNSIIFIIHLIFNSINFRALNAYVNIFTCYNIIFSSFRISIRLIAVDYFPKVPFRLIRYTRASMRIRAILIIQFHFTSWEYIPLSLQPNFSYYLLIYWQAITIIIWVNIFVLLRALILYNWNMWFRTFELRTNSIFWIIVDFNNANIHRTIFESKDHRFSKCHYCVK